jgi:hypothetical protein
MANAYDFVLTDPISAEMGLYRGALKGDRAARADIFEKLLRDKILAVTFYLKNSLAIGQTRVAVCTRNDCWIKYDPDEERRQAERAERLKASVTPVAQGKPKSTIYQTGIIPVYDIMKGSWISFDVDNVESIRGVISEEIDEIWDERKQYGKIGYSSNPSTVIRTQTHYGLTTSNGTGGGGLPDIVTVPATGGGVVVTVTTHGAGGGGGGPSIFDKISQLYNKKVP